MAELLINGKDALAEYGVRMGDGFINAIGAPLPMKENIENDSRIKDGKEVIRLGKIASRQLTLEFAIVGASRADFQGKKQAFLSALYEGMVSISVPSDSNEIYRLNYLGNSPSYSQTKSGCACRISIRFEEPDPTNRT